MDFTISINIRVIENGFIVDYSRYPNDDFGGGGSYVNKSIYAADSKAVGEEVQKLLG